MGSFVPTTQVERIQMLSDIGISTMEDLFGAIPDELKVGQLHLPKGLSELEVYNKLYEIAQKNKVFTSIFRGAGAYDHYIPAIVKTIVSRENFLTAYTPYQAEISQGILQSIFEYQTMICQITGMDVSNASVYDGATAAAEAVAMCTDRKRNKVYVSATSNPFVIETIKTYCFGSNVPFQIIAEKDGVIDLDTLKDVLDDKTACVYLQQPNYSGLLEDADTVSALVHDSGAKFIMGVNPISLGLLKTPGEYKADIAVGEGQPLGLPLSFGGPYFGFMATTTAMMRKLPGRIVGETKDLEGKRAFVLTLQAREQHIRREKATSNICTNQALCALTASVYLSTLGPEGYQEVASQCYSKAHYLASEIANIPGFELRYKSDFFNEFVTNCPVPLSELMSLLEKNNILGGLPVKNGILWCVTEKNTKSQMDTLVNLLKEVASI